MQEELMAVIEGQGLVANGADNTLLRQAITKMIQAGQRSVIINNATFAPAVAGTGQIVYWDSANNRFDLAIADGTVKQNAVGAADVANANVYCFGDATLFAGLTPGSRYYLSATVAGAMTLVLGGTNAVYIGIARNATELFVDIDLVTATNGMPVGTIYHVPATAAPAGSIKANGALLSRANYADLWAYAQASGNLAATDGAWVAGQFSPGDGATTFRIPDGRGEFIRGWDDGRGADTGRAIGTAQADALQGHYHSSRFQQIAGAGTAVNVAYEAGPNFSSDTVRQPITDGTNGTPRTAAETRPRNIALLACIKY